MAEAGNSTVNDDLNAKLADMTMVQLKDKLKKRKLKTTGAKNELILRLSKIMQIEHDHGAADEKDDNDTHRRREDTNESDTNSSDDDEESIRRGQNRTNNFQRNQFLTFRDVEESLETFSGDDKTNVTKWIEDFEEMAALCEWGDMQKMAYGKRLLRGSAKLFANYEKSTKTWKKLRKALIEEFSDVVDSRAVHQELTRRKKKSDESYHAYIYKMLQIAAQANVDTRSVIQYIIEGIQDDAVNKTILHGAKSIRELKEKFIQYEAIRREGKSKMKQPRPEEDKKKKTNQGDPNSTENKRCFNCGSRNHLGKSCPTKDKGAKCFKCNQYGHIAKLCKETVSTQKEAAYIIVNTSQQKQCKQIEIANQQFTSIVDTGSDLSLINQDCYQKIGCPELKNKINFDGFGALNNSTYGSFATNVVIDDETFKIVFHVVDNQIMKHAILIGADFLNQIELHAIRGQVTIRKIVSDVPEVLKIDTVQSTDVFDFSHISDKDARQEIESIARKYEPKKTREIDIKMTLILKDDIPIYQKSRRLSQLEKNEVDKQLKTWLNDGIIRPSNSEYASPIVLVKKKNGDTRICIDYRKLNKKVIKDRYPLPLIEDQLDRLQDAKIFSTLDLKNGFFHVKVDEESRKYTSFVVPTGQYEFMRMPFGLCNSPAIFQKYINAIFKDLIYKGIVLTYMDDLVIPSQDTKQAINNLKCVFEVSSQAGLHINWHKCRFLQTKIEYLGHTVENGTIRPSEYKTNAVIKFPTPKCIRDVQSFLGLTGYFRKFIFRYFRKFIFRYSTQPLTNLLKANTEFKFGKDEQHAFQKLKNILSNKPVLKLYKQGAETELHTDASKFGYGAVLFQKDYSDNMFHPIYYASGKTTSAEENYTSYELEVLAIIKSLKKFRVYLLGIPFKIITDCKAFTLTMNKKDLSVRIARWALALEEYNYEIQHRPAKSMMHVDALSRNPLPEALLINESNDSLIARFMKAQNTDQDLQKIIKLAKLNKADGYIMRNNLLYRDDNDELLIVVPKALQTSIIQKAHEQGHFSVNKTELLLRKDYWFKGMQQKIKKIVSNCINCILAERKQGKQEGLLNVISKGEVPLDTYHVDHLGPLPSTKKNYRHIFIVVDAFSKFVWLYATKSTDTAEVLDRLRKQSTIFGNPRRIISDRGVAFTANAFKDYCSEEKIQHLLITTGIPRGNGQVERINRTLIPLLTKLSTPKPEEWFKFLDIAQKYLNATFSRSTSRTPYQLMFGTHMRLKEDPQVREIIENEWTRMYEEERDDIRQQAKAKIAEIQRENIKNYNKKRKKAQQYKTGDLVAIKRTQLGPGLKFRDKFLGPYRITKIMCHDRYVVTKIGNHEGPLETSTSADFMKPWLHYDNEDETESERE